VNAYYSPQQNRIGEFLSHIVICADLLLHRNLNTFKIPRLGKRIQLKKLQRSKPE